MRPRINKDFGNILWKDLNDYFIDNRVFPFIVKEEENYLTYARRMMFRSNKKDPEIIYIKVSRVSKLVVDAWSANGYKFKSINELKEYTKYNN